MFPLLGGVGVGSLDIKQRNYTEYAIYIGKSTLNLKL